MCGSLTKSNNYEKNFMPFYSKPCKISKLFVILDRSYGLKSFINHNVDESRHRVALSACHVLNDHVYVNKLMFKMKLMTFKKR